MNRKKVEGVIIFGWIIFILGIFFYYKRIDVLWLRVGENFFRIFLLSLFLLVNAALGRKILNWLGFKANSFLEYLLFELAIGLGIFTHLVIGFGMVGLLNRWVMNVAILGIFSFTYPEVKSIIYTGKNKLRYYFASKRNILNIDTLLILVLFIQTVINLAGASVLPSSWDGLGEHLAISKEWIRLYRLAPVPYINYDQWGGPFNIGILYTAAMLIKDAVLAKLIHFAFGILIAISIYTLGKKYFSTRVGLLSALIFYTIPVVAWNSTTATVDLGVTFYCFLAFYAFISWSISRKRPWLIISGVISGLGLGSKYVAFLCLIILSLGILIDGWIFKKEKFSHAIKNFLLFSILGISVGSFWYARAYFMMGAHLPGVLQDWLQSFLRNLKDLWIGGIFSSPAYAFDPAFLKRVSTLPWEISMHPEKFHGLGSIGILFLAFLPFFIFLPRVRKNPLMKFILYYSLIFYFFWVISAPYKRYLIPVFPLFSVMVAYIVEVISNSHRTLRISLYSIIFLIFIFNIVYLPSEGLDKVHQHLLILIGIKSQEDYILENEKTYRVFKYVNENLASHTRVFILNDPRTFYCDRNYVTVIFEGGKPLNYSSLEEEEILTKFKQAGITHVVTNEWLLEQGYGRYIWNRLSEEFKKDHLKTLYEHYPFTIYKIVYKGEYPFEPFDKEKILNVDQVEVTPQKAKGKDSIFLYWNGSIKIPGMIFKPGDYEVSLLCRGDKADNIGPIIKFEKLTYHPAPISYFEREVVFEREIKNLNWEWIEFSLSIIKEEKLILKFSFINDGSNPVTKEDRNFYLKQFKIKRRES